MKSFSWDLYCQNLWLLGQCINHPNRMTFLSNLEDILKKLRSDCEIVVLAIVTIVFCRDQAVFLNILQTLKKPFWLDQIIAESSRITRTTSSLLGHNLWNNKGKICQSGTIPVGRSDHLLTYCTSKNSKEQINKDKTPKLRSLKNRTCADWNFWIQYCLVNFQEHFTINI